MAWELRGVFLVESLTLTTGDLGQVTFLLGLLYTKVVGHMTSNGPSGFDCNGLPTLGEKPLRLLPLPKLLPPSIFLST